MRFGSSNITQTIINEAVEPAGDALAVCGVKMVVVLFGGPN